MKEFKPQDFTILMVDDVSKNIQVLGSILSSHDYEAEYALNGKDALESAQQFTYDLILLDIMMPIMDGYEVCKTIRTMPQYDDVPVIFITAKTDKESILHGFQMGAQDYVTKPFDASELLARVKTQLELRHSKLQLKQANEWLEQKVDERTEELRLAMEELKELDSVKTDFLKIISHEIRTPLNGIMGFTDILATQVEDETAQMCVQELDIASKRLYNYAEQALMISDLKMKKDKALYAQDIDIKPLLEQAIDTSRTLSEENDIQLETKLTEATLVADVEKMQTCFDLLVGNAITHSKPGGTVVIELNNLNNGVQLTIQDAGDGFPQLLIDKGIKPFVSPDHNDENPGLDLYLCKLIVEAHGGVLALSNDNGGFVSVTFMDS